MRRIVLISCVSTKDKTKITAKAKNLYKGSLFLNSLAYGQSLKPDKIFILSAKYHLLGLETEINHYDVTLSYVTPEKRKKKPNLEVLSKTQAIKWGEIVLEQLKKEADLEIDKFIILAGKTYLEPIKKSLKNIEEPLEGIVLGKRAGKLIELINEINDKRTT
jgi:hypothetical protein